MTSSSLLLPYEKGDKVLLTNKQNETYEGTVFSKNKFALRLRNVSLIPYDGHMFKQLEFDYSEIEKILKLNIDESCESTAKSSESENDTKTSTVFADLKRDVDNATIVTKIGPTFNEFMDDLDNYKIIGLTGEGSENGRFGQLGILGISTIDGILLLDISNLGPRAFTACREKLKTVLESKDKLKVVHNCRLLSDCLNHKYNVTLQNVYDTEVMNAIVNRIDSGLFPEASDSLSDLAFQHLDIPKAVLNAAEKGDSTLWRKRPLSEELISVASWRVSVLLPLRLKLEDALLAPFDKLCELYLNVVREADFCDARTLEKRNHRLPKEILDLNASVQRQ